MYRYICIGALVHSIFLRRFVFLRGSFSIFHMHVSSVKLLPHCIADRKSVNRIIRVSISKYLQDTTVVSFTTYIYTFLSIRLSTKYDVSHLFGILSGLHFRHGQRICSFREVGNSHLTNCKIYNADPSRG